MREEVIAVINALIQQRRRFKRIVRRDLISANVKYVSYNTLKEDANIFDRIIIAY